jgi:tight adherence protein B
MGLIIFLVFLGVFALISLVMIASGSGAAQQSKQVLASLDSALATDGIETREQIMSLRKSEALSAIPWLNQKLGKLELAPTLSRLLSQADLSWSVGGLLSMTAACMVFPGYLVWWRTGSVLFGLIVGLVFGSAPISWVFFKRGRRFDKFQQVLPEALDLMVSALRAGHSLIAAMGLVARECPDPVGTEFKSCFEEQNYGLELKAALDNMILRVPLQDLRIVSTAIMIQKESGGNLAEVLDKTSHVIRERFRLKRQVGVHTAQGRLTGWILTFLPVVLGFALYMINPEMMSLLWTRAIGIKLLWAASIMIVVGGLIIRKIVNLDI